MDFNNSQQDRALTPCPRCKARGKPAEFGSDPICAFPSFEFHGQATGGHNWNCATMCALRAILGESRDEFMEVGDICFLTSQRDDQSAAMLYSRETGWLYFVWYKSRGATEGAWDARGRPLTLEDAEAVIAAWERAIEGNAALEHRWAECTWK